MLFERYPELFPGGREPNPENRMQDGFCCGDGWFELIDELSRISFPDILDEVTGRGYQRRFPFSSIAIRPS